MSNNKQSSIDWYANESWQLKVQLDNQEISVDEYAVAYVRLLYKAKEMHKSEIIWAHGIKMKGVNNLQCVSGEQYYNERYGNDKQ